MKEVIINSPSLEHRSQGTVNKFFYYVNIPRSDTGNPVRVQVLDVKTSMAVKLLPAFEDPFIMMLKTSTTSSFSSDSTIYTYLTVDTSYFNLAQSYDNMFYRCLTPVDFDNKLKWGDLLKEYDSGMKWTEMLMQSIFNQSRFFSSSAMFEAFRTNLAYLYRKYLDPMLKRTNWYSTMKMEIGPLFMVMKKRDGHAAWEFLKWLWLENNSFLTDLNMEVKSNHPVSNQIRIVNTSNKYLQFDLLQARNDHSLFTLFNTLPIIHPFSYGVSTGADFMPKEPFTNLSVHSNLCHRKSYTGYESSDLLCYIFTGDDQEGFQKQDDIEQLPLILSPGYQLVSFEIRASGLRDDLTYLNQDTARTTIKLRFFW